MKNSCRLTYGVPRFHVCVPDAVRALHRPDFGHGCHHAHDGVHLPPSVCLPAERTERYHLRGFCLVQRSSDVSQRRPNSPSQVHLFEQDLVPNHHLSLHLYTCLLLFGAVAGWWAFPFERYNGLVAKTETNNKPGATFATRL